MSSAETRLYLQGKQPAPPKRHDPMFGHVPRNHPELAARAVTLHRARESGQDVDFELKRLIDDWEANR